MAMKSWLFFLLLSSKLFSLYMGNPSASQLIDEGFFLCKSNDVAIKAGYQRDWVFDRKMKDVSYGEGGSQIDHFDWIAEQGVCTLNLFNRLEIYGSAGTASFHSCDIDMNRITECTEYQTDDRLIWGCGFRGILSSWKGVTLGIQGAYQRASHKINWIKMNGTPIATNPNTPRLLYHEWQLTFGASYQIALFHPYIAGKYASAQGHFFGRYDWEQPKTNLLGTIKNKGKFGMVLGTTFSNENRFGATVEIALIDQQSITVAGELKF